MTKKDYEIIADCIKSSLLTSIGLMDSHLLSQYLVKAFKKDNPRFDAKKFLKASGLDRERLNQLIP